LVVKTKPVRKHAQSRAAAPAAPKTGRAGRPTGPRDKVLESALSEVTTEPGAQIPDEDVAVLCPFCDEEFEIHATSESDGQTRYESCEVCARPVLITIEIEDGQFQVEVQRA
jgi:hypothetical protein